jgi:hypothetical protein
MQEPQVHTDACLTHACDVASTVPSLDYVGWYGEHFVVIRYDNPGSSAVCGLLGGGGVAGGACVELRELPVRRRPRERRRGVDRAEGRADRLRDVRTRVLSTLFLARRVGAEGLLVLPRAEDCMRNTVGGKCDPKCE